MMVRILDNQVGMTDYRPPDDTFVKRMVPGGVAGHRDPLCAKRFGQLLKFLFVLPDDFASGFLQ